MPAMAGVVTNPSPEYATGVSCATASGLMATGVTATVVTAGVAAPALGGAAMLVAPTAWGCFAGGIGSLSSALWPL